MAEVVQSLNAPDTKLNESASQNLIWGYLDQVELTQRTFWITPFRGYIRRLFWKCCTSYVWSPVFCWN